MNLRDMLKRDFGLELKISGGYGLSRDDPIIVLNSIPFDASMTEMHILRAIGKEHSTIWSTLARTPLENDRLSLEQITIRTIEVIASEIAIQKKNYYFDINMAVARGKVLPTVIAFSDKSSKLRLPYEIGWLHYDGVTDYDAAAGLGQGIAYGAPGMKATVYVYDRMRTDIPSDIDASVVRSELEVAVSDLMKVQPTASPLAETNSKVLLIQRFNIDGEFSLIALGVCRGKFIKLRITCTPDPLLVEVVNQSITAFEDVIVANSQQGLH
jgi:hypothetical protein